MNKGISLPRLRSNSQHSKPFLQMEVKKGVYSKKMEPIKEQRMQNDEQQFKTQRKGKFIEFRRAKSQVIKKQNANSDTIVIDPLTHDNKPSHAKQRKYELLQNGKLSKITENSLLSKGLSSDRTNYSKIQSYDKQKAATLKKQLNEITSSILILKKQIKSIEGGTLQIRQQLKNMQQKPPQQNFEMEKKIEDLRNKTQNLRYYQEVLKNMKDRMKKINIHYEKKAMNLKDILEKQERKIKILNQRTSIREESINKQKMIVKIVEQNEKTISRLNELAMHQFDKKLKELESQKQVSDKHGLLNTINEGQYHLQVYKKQAAVLYNEIKANLFLQHFLDIKWHKYSQIYVNAEKAEKLMKIHSLEKNSKEFDPFQTFYGSYDIKKQLQEKIKIKEKQFAECMKRNAELQKQWKKVQYKEIDEQERIIDKQSMEIKSGKVEEKVLFEKHQRELILEMRRKFERFEQRATKISRIKDWILKIEGQIEIKPKNQGNIEERLLSVINWSKREHKKQKQMMTKTL